LYVQRTVLPSTAVTDRQSHAASEKNMLILVCTFPCTGPVSQVDKS
jgi:hypothetical protein